MVEDNSIQKQEQLGLKKEQENYSSNEFEIDYSRTHIWFNLELLTTIPQVLESIKETMPVVEHILNSMLRIVISIAVLIITSYYCVKLILDMIIL